MCRNTKSSIVPVAVLVMFMLVGLINAATVCNSTNSSVRSFLVELSDELTSLTILEQKLQTSISMLASNNSDLINIASVRTKQLKKIQTAKASLSLEVETLKAKCNQGLGNDCICSLATPQTSSLATLQPNTSTCSSSSPKASLDNGSGTSASTGLLGYRYEDGTYASSCFSYKNPTPGLNRVPQNVSGLYQVKIGSVLTSVYCDMETMGGGWTLLMMCSNSSKFNYEHNVWTDNFISPSLDVPFTNLNDSSKDYVSPMFYMMRGTESRLSFKNLESYNAWYHSSDTARNLANSATMSSAQSATGTCAPQTNCGTQPVNKIPQGMLSSLGYTYPTSTWNRFGYVNSVNTYFGTLVRVGFTGDNDWSDSQDTVFGIGLSCSTTTSGVSCPTDATTVSNKPNGAGSAYYAYRGWTPSVPIHDAAVRAWLWMR